MKNYMDEALVG